VRGDVVAIDEKTILIENFGYDGTGFGEIIIEVCYLCCCALWL